MGRLLGFLMLVVLVITGLTFAVQNAEPVALDYYFGKRDIPLSLIIVGALAVGALLGVLASTSVILRQKYKISSLNKKLRSHEKLSEKPSSAITVA